MDKDKVLYAEIHPVENRCYRYIVIRDSLKINDYEEECDEPVSSHVEDDYDDSDIVIIHAGNRFHSTLHVPGIFLGLVKGKSGRMQKALEQQYSCTIKIPPPNYPERGINIFGSDKPHVSQAYRRIQDIVNNARLKEDFTHFVSIPINSSEIQDSFQSFQKKVLEKYNKTKRIDAGIFQNPKKLHVTVTTLVLLEKNEKELAESILTDCVKSVLKDFDGKEFLVHVKGIEYMNDDPGEVDVLYAKLNEIGDDTSLQVLADKIMEAFVRKKFSKDQYDKVKLHVTLMNTRFRSTESSEDQIGKRVTFDARPILEDYQDYDFGRITLSEIHISIRYSESPVDGYYSSSCKVKLN